MVAGALAATVRASRLAMGTVVGLTVVTDDPAAAPPAIDAAYACIEAWEARLSEWRPDSAIATLNRTGGPLTLPAEATALLVWAERLRVDSGGRFDILWRGGAGHALRHEGDQWSLHGGPIDLGGMLKGFLNDRAGEVLLAAGLEDFLLDAAGDVLAHGDAEGGSGWVVEVHGARGRHLRARLHDEALSTSGNREQPGHVHDATTGAAVGGEILTSVIAPDGTTADALATALLAGAPVELAERYRAVAVRVEDDRPSWSATARRRFR